jgi:AraC-like DNA-binding protein
MSSLTASRPTSATPMAFVQSVIWAYQQQELNPETALAAAQITPSEARNRSGRITAGQFERLSFHAMRELDDEALGWFGRRLPWGSYGMLARASISAPTLGMALRRWCRHHGLLTDDIRLELVTQGSQASLRLTDPRPSHPLREFCHVSVLRNAWGLASWFIDSRIPLQQATFSFAPPLHQEAYTVLFPASTAPQFDAPLSAMIFNASYLDLPLRRDEKALTQMLQHALPLLVQTYRRDRLLVERTRQALQSQPQNTHNAQQLAALLHVSPRTLHRQLQEQGTTLQVLKDQVRQERATELLLRTRKPIKQVAEAAGFMNEKSFIRAFRHWTGQTPADFRRQQGQAIPPNADCSTP